MTPTIESETGLDCDLGLFLKIISSNILIEIDSLPYITAICQIVISRNVMTLTNLLKVTTN